MGSAATASRIRVGAGLGGVPDSLDEAKAAFRAAPLIDGAPAEAGQRLLSSKKADEKCST
jgi:hypothetical protein